MTAIERVQTLAAKVIGLAPVETPEAVQEASEALRLLHTARQEADAKRKELKAPHLAAGRSVDAVFQPAIREADRVIGIIKRRLSERALRIEAERTAALAAPPEKANEALAAIDDTPLPPGVSERFTWQVEAVDVAKVPSVFLKLDEARVAQVVKASAAAAVKPEIPGVTFKRVVMIQARRKK